MVKRVEEQDFKILSGSASFLLPSYLAGSVGGVCALANVLGDVLCRMHSLYENHVIDKDLQRRLIDPNAMVVTMLLLFLHHDDILSCIQQVTKRFGVAGMKAALDIFGYFGGKSRSPVQNVNEEIRKLIRISFVNNGFLPN